VGSLNYVNLISSPLSILVDRKIKEKEEALHNKTSFAEKKKSSFLGFWGNS